MKRAAKSAQMLRKTMPVVVFGAALVLFVALLCAPQEARATGSETEELDNTVNVQQLPDSSFIYDTPLKDLAGADSYHDNQTVQVVGEVIGDNLRANALGDKRWITVTSVDEPGAYALSVCMSAASAEAIDTYGRYGAVGTTVQIRGTFHLACDEHEGVTDLHADYVSVVEQGYSTKDSFHWEVFVPGVATILLGFALMVAFRIMRERRR